MAKLTDKSQAKETDTKPPILESVGIVFSILEHLATMRRPLGVTELAVLMNEPKPRIYRHLASMSMLNIVEQDIVSEKYRLGPRLVWYGNAASEQFDLKAIADPYLTQLRDLTGQTAILSVPRDDAALVVATVESLSNVCITVKPGNRVDGPSSAQGRIVLAYSDVGIKKRKKSHSSQLDMANRESLAKKLQIIRERMYETADGESIDGINVLAAPVFQGSEGQDRLIAVIGIIGTSKDIPAEPGVDLVGALHEVAGSLSARLNAVTYLKKS